MTVCPLGFVICLCWTACRIETSLFIHILLFLVFCLVMYSERTVSGYVIISVNIMNIRKLWLRYCKI